MNNTQTNGQTTNANADSQKDPRCMDAYRFFGPHPTMADAPKLKQFAGFKAEYTALPEEAKQEIADGIKAMAA